MRTMDVWTYREAAWPGIDISGFGVEARDGGIGKVDEATYDAATGGYVVVDTGPWIFGKKVMLPAGVVETVDAENRKVFVDRTREEIENAPEFDETAYREDMYRNRIGEYYGRRDEPNDPLT